MKELKKCYYQSIRSNNNSLKHSDKVENQYKSQRQSPNYLKEKTISISKKEPKNKNIEKKKSLFEIYNLYKHSIDSSMSRQYKKKTVTPHNSASSKKNSNSSTKIHGTSISISSNKDEESSHFYINPFELPRPTSALDTKALIKEKVKQKVDLRDFQKKKDPEQEKSNSKEKTKDKSKEEKETIE